MASSRTSQKSAKGIVDIAEVHPEGKFILLENMFRREEEMSEWKLKQKIDGKREIVYTFPANFVLKDRAFVKIWSKNQGGMHSPPDHLELDGEWGTGSNVETILYNKEGSERATNIKRELTNE